MLNQSLWIRVKMTEPLETYGVIGYDGQALNGLRSHPDGVHLVYPLGDKVTILNWQTKKMTFLNGHDNIVAAVAISPKGTFIGSGQINHIGFKAMVCLWDYETKKMVGTHSLHKVRVESIVFSCDESLMITIGGRDCGQAIIWDTVSNSAICTVTASRTTSGEAIAINSLNKRPCIFITGGDGTLRLWTFNTLKKFITPFDIPLGKLKRMVLCVTTKDDDSLAYCGTSSGDILKIALGFDKSSDGPEPLHLPNMMDCMAKCGKWKKNALRPEVICYKSGVRCILILEDGNLVVGAGDGTVDVVKEIKFSKPFAKGKLISPVSPVLEVVQTYKFPSAVTSIQFRKLLGLKGRPERGLLVGTVYCEIFSLSLETFEVKLLLTSHSSSANAVAFPWNMSDVFATAGVGDIRVWALHTRIELLRILVPNFACTCLVFAPDGKSIISGWNDGEVRAFTPLTGRLIYHIHNCHNTGTSAMAIASNGRMLVTGGCSGRVRIWDIQPEKQSLVAVLKEHKCPISALRIDSTDTEAVSVSTDGSCIIWDIVNRCRRQILLANTVFMGACYHPSGCQILTTGTDRRIAYWEAGTGNLAREVEVSRTAAVNTVDINHTGELFVTGGNDEKIRLWKYQEGIYTHMSSGGVATDIKFSPDGRYIVNTTAAGSIFIWKTPQVYLTSGRGDADSVSTTKRGSIGRGNREENISGMNTSRSSVISNGESKDKKNKQSKKSNEECVCLCDKASSRSSRTTTK